MNKLMFAFAFSTAILAFGCKKKEAGDKAAAPAAGSAAAGSAAAGLAVEGAGSAAAGSAAEGAGSAAAGSAAAGSAAAGSAAAAPGGNAETAAICKRLEELATKEGGEALKTWENNLKSDCTKEIEEQRGKKGDKTIAEFKACLDGAESLSKAIEACKQID